MPTLRPAARALSPAVSLVSLVSLTALTALAALAGCSVDAAEICLEPSCTAHARGPARGKRADGRIDVDAVTAWPGRGAEPTPLTAQEIARACALVGACATPEDKAHTRLANGDDAMAMITALCGTPPGAEERAVPSNGTNERWSYWAREVLARAPSCEAIHGISTDSPEGMYCEEDGCWVKLDRPAVSCAGDVATLSVAGKATRTRDCTRAFAHCDASSETGCTDRHPLACDPTAMDRCDGDVKLGCDSGGVVSFHDCSLVHAQCVQYADGAACVPVAPPSCALDMPVCEGTRLSSCVYGAKVAVDCADFGATCVRGHCAFAATP